VLPILISAPQVKSTAMLFLDGKPAYGLQLPDDALAIFADGGRRQKFERQFGTVSDSHQAGISAALLLVQAIENRDVQQLRNYASWQAVAEVKAEQELAERIVRRFGAAGARHLAVIPETLRARQEKTLTEERDKLRNRVAKQSPMVGVAELLLQLNRWTSGARFVVYFDRTRKKALPGLFCPDVGTGLAALTFDRIPSSQGLGVCVRCGKAFLRTRPAQHYHSLRCGNAGRKARERARKRRNAK
jgi:hypothetical protein